MHTLDDTSHPAKIEPALPIQAAEKKQTGSDTFDFSLSLSICLFEYDESHFYEEIEYISLISVDRVDSLKDNREVRSITINKGNASLGITVSPDTLGRGLVIRSVINNGAVARDGTLEAGDIITNVNNSDVAGLETEKARQLIRHHSFHSTKVT